MKLSTRLMVGVVGGVVIGAAPTLYFTRKHYLDLAEREIKQVRDHYRIIHSKPDSPEELLPEEPDILESAIESEEQIVSESISEEAGYTQYDKSMQDRMVEKNLFERLNGEGGIEIMADKPGPAYITANQYIDLEEDIAQVTITYYQEDDTLANEEDEVVDGLGRGFPDGWRELLAKEEALYIFDDGLSRAYELLLDVNSYGRVVLGE